MRCSCHILGDTISIHAPRTGSDLYGYLGTIPLYISIHAPRTGSDSFVVPLEVLLAISIHAPRTGSDNSALYNL